MSELISRQAAIDMIEKYFNGLPIAVHYDMLAMIHRLPSVQPEIIRCKDCKHLFEDNGCPLRTWWTHTEDDFCSYAERREEKR